MNPQFSVSTVTSHLAATWVAINGPVKVSIFLLCTLVVACQEAAAQPQVTGLWVTLPYLMPINPIRVDLLRNGKVLIVSFASEGLYAYDPNVIAACPPADFTVERIGDLLNYELSALFAGKQSVQTFSEVKP